jgi:hypothetical protein
MIFSSFELLSSTVVVATDLEPPVSLEDSDVLVAV